MLDPRKWPRKLAVNGIQGALRIQTGHDDAISILRGAVDEVPPTQGLGLFYARVENGREIEIGPFYCWSSEPRVLFERFWIEPHPKDRISTDYIYYASGKLYRYSRTRHSKQFEKEFEWFKELFYPDGRLMAVGYSRLDSDGRRSNGFYRDGRPITDDAFQRLKRPKE